jgi:hypothetical protein
MRQRAAEITRVRQEERLRLDGRYAGMARDKLQTQRHIQAALSDRDTRVAILIGASLRLALDLLDEQPPSVIEVIVSLAKERQLTGNFPKHRSELREALIKYAEEACLKEARARESRLFHGITGQDEETLEK